MAVRPEWQGGKLAEGNPNMEVGGLRDEAYRGSWRFGSRMLQELSALYEIPAQKMPDQMPEAIVVLGDPAFYGRWGFSLERAQNLNSPYPLSHTLILKRGMDLPEEKLVYPAAFSAL